MTEKQQKQLDLFKDFQSKQQERTLDSIVRSQEAATQEKPGEKPTKTLDTGK